VEEDVAEEAAAGSTGVPHAGQKVAAGGSSLPHFAQNAKSVFLAYSHCNLRIYGLGETEFSEKQAGHGPFGKVAL